MNIQYIEPLSRGIARTKKDLFRTLDLRNWFVVGFTAFLAGLADTRLSGGFPGTNFKKGSRVDVEQVLYFPQKAWEWLADHPGWAMLIAFGIFLACVIGIVITWVSSRGKFMFLDNVVRGRARVVAPWYEYRKEGNSLFGWHLLWVVFSAAIVIAYLFYCIRFLQLLYESSGTARALIMPAILEGLGLIVLSVVSVFFYVLLRDFVVPIMYRYRISGGEAIQKLLPLFASQSLYFIGYGLFLFCLSLLIVAAIVIVGCATCCIAFLILAIPFINSVVLLPVAYALRAFSVEFLEQFGPEYRIFPVPDPNPPEINPVTL